MRETLAKTAKTAKKSSISESLISEILISELGVLCVLARVCPDPL